MYATKICQQLAACADKLGTGDGGNESLVWFGHGHLTRLNLEQACTGLLWNVNHEASIQAPYLFEVTKVNKKLLKVTKVNLQCSYRYTKWSYAVQYYCALLALPASSGQQPVSMVFYILHI